MISHVEIEIMREFSLKIGDFNAHDIVVALLCKISVVALQEYFKFKFGIVLVINSNLNKVYVINLALRVYL